MDKRILSDAEKRIEEFVIGRGYDFEVKTLVEFYRDYYKKGHYISYTTKDCISHLEAELETLSNGGVY